MLERQKIVVGLYFLQLKQRAVNALVKSSVFKQSSDVLKAASALRNRTSEARKARIPHVLSTKEGEDLRDEYRAAREKQLRLPEDTRIVEGIRSIGLAPLVFRFRRNYGRNKVAQQVAREMADRYRVPISARHVLTCEGKVRIWLEKRSPKAKMLWFIYAM
ncbi:hypothetical protein B0E45_14635 [Sinorhizobium sp. A49]|nr:hypothetical protein B0E45_14635 [Sinorhizobium sp. A49]